MFAPLCAGLIQKVVPGRAVVLHGRVFVALLLVCEKPIEGVTLPVTEHERRPAPPHREDMVVGIRVLIKRSRRRAEKDFRNVLDLLDPRGRLLDRFQPVIL